MNAILGHPRLSASVCPTAPPAGFGFIEPQTPPLTSERVPGSHPGGRGFESPSSISLGRIGSVIRRGSRTAVLVCCLLVVCAQNANAAQRANKPDLTIESLRLTASTVVQGGSLTIHDKTANVGKHAAPGSTTVFYLGTGPKRKSGDVRLGKRKIDTLKKLSSSAGNTTVQVPASTAPGSYRVISCADDAKKVSEENEKNNCSSVALTVDAAADTTPPTFAGLTSASPVGGCGFVDPNHPCHAEFQWNPASDNATPASQIVYDIYRGTASGGEDFSHPMYTSEPGATSFAAPSSDTYVGCWVARARDLSGNRDANTHEICLSQVP